MSDLKPCIHTLPAWTAAGIRAVVPMSELPTVFPETFDKVARLVTAAGGMVVGPAYARYFGMPTDVVDMEIGFGIAAPVESEELVVTAHPTRRAVIATHIGPYDTLAESYEKLMPWLESQDLDLDDSMFEFYDTGPEVPPADTVTRLVFPLD
ncbi:GyrI-like domain-containing protein [Gordonia rhizosphera]|uniref:Putative MerR family transcriptional regulator n=1 Tax=Gordonia rhizosphera NBRC 16068 TaxID=1108045 RepID=K6VYG0_9ACTN|nr:GyrI-like domain-containing protein [Gordonia rhizosphera]GAB91935.1 putative MerR family transcriptional regulator [Gordonia rhizosphera NBRC 16068]